MDSDIDIQQSVDSNVADKDITDPTNDDTAVDHIEQFDSDVLLLYQMPIPDRNKYPLIYYTLLFFRWMNIRNHIKKVFSLAKNIANIIPWMTTMDIDETWRLDANVNDIADDVQHLYDKFRIQPFYYGNYLRANIVGSGYGSFIFHTWNLFSWSSERILLMPAIYRYIYSIIHMYLLSQFILNLLLIIPRMIIHIQCWSCCQLSDYQESLDFLHNMLYSNVWKATRILGRIQDGLNIVFLLFAQLILSFIDTFPLSDTYEDSYNNTTTSTLSVTDNIISTNASIEVKTYHNDTTMSSDGNPMNPRTLLSNYIIALSSTAVFIFLLRVIVATLFTVTCQHSRVIQEARARGMTANDIEKLPVFKYKGGNHTNHTSIHKNGAHYTVNLNRKDVNIEEQQGPLDMDTDMDMDTAEKEESHNNNNNNTNNKSHECSICLNKFEIGDELITLPCSYTLHTFHAVCIKQWLNKQNACPLCQQNI